MKLFGWMQNKLNGKQTNNGKSPAAVPVQHPVKQQLVKEEFSDWPHGLLAIGTFGNNDLQEDQHPPRQRQDQIIHEEEEEEEDPTSSSVDLTPEEVVKLQKELKKLLTRKPRGSNADKETTDLLPLDKFLNCPSSLEVERRIRESFRSIGSDAEGRSGEEGDIEKTISAIIEKCRDVCAETKNKKSIGKQSISFLLKKMFVCRGGFMPTPSLRDTLQETKMEKILRTMLHKKMQSQCPTRSSSVKRYLHDNRMSKSGREEETHDERSSDRCKWVKTDSEFIVLEM